MLHSLHHLIISLSREIAFTLTRSLSTCNNFLNICNIYVLALWALLTCSLVLFVRYTNTTTPIAMCGGPNVVANVCGCEVVAYAACTEWCVYTTNYMLCIRCVSTEFKKISCVCIFVCKKKIQFMLVKSCAHRVVNFKGALISIKWNCRCLS